MEESKKNKLKKISFEIGKYILYLLIFYFLMNARITHFDSCFAFGFLFALMWCSQKVWALSISYLAASLIYSVNIEFLICSITTIFVMLLFYYFHKLIKKPMKPILVLLYTILSQISFVYYNVGNIVSIDFAVYFIAGILFLFASINILQVIFLRGIFYRLTLDEGLCLFIVICITSIGLSTLTLFDSISLQKILLVLGGLFLISLNKQLFAIIFALAVGLGGAIYSMDISIIAEFVIVIAAASIFRYPYRWFMAVSLVLVDAILLYFFVGQNYFYLLNSAIAGTIFLLIPNSWIDKLSDKWYVAESDISMRNIVSVSRKNIRKRMQNLSGVFFDMERLYKGMVKGALTRDQVRDMLFTELNKSVCADCPERSRCLRANGGTGKDSLMSLVETAIDKGKISILDLPTYLSTKCGQTNKIIGRINQIVEQYSNYNNMSLSIDNSKILLAETLGGVSKLLINLGDEIDKNITFDSDKEAQIQNKLLAENIICSEVMLYFENMDKLTATLVVKGEQAYSPIIEKIVSNICNVPMSVLEVSASERIGWYVVGLGRKNKYEISFGLATVKKTGSEVSGDCHSLLRLGANKFLLALSDGMGSGEKAEKLSSLTIGLIENFYKAGFDNEIVLSSVNKLLCVNSQEVYSALDICLIDLEQGIADLIKVGAPFGIIRRSDRIDKVEGGALPIGVLDSVSPTIYRTTISTDDIVIMATDGVTDAFENVVDFADFIQEQITINPQTLAENIFAEALSRQGGIAKDDMTVLVARTYKKTK